MKDFSLTYQQKMVRVEDLKPHPFLERLGLDGPNDYYVGAARRFKHYDNPVINECNQVLSNWHEVEAATANGVEQIQVVECFGLAGNRILEFINFRAYFQQKKDYGKLYEVMKEFEKLYKEESCDWFNSLPGDKDDKMGAVIGLKSGMAKKLRCIGESAPMLFEEISKGEMSLRQAYNLVNKPAQSKIKQGTNQSVGQIPQFDVENISFSLTNGSNYLITVTNKVPQIYINGNPFKTPSTSYGGIQYPESVHYCFQLSENETIQLSYKKTK